MCACSLRACMRVRACSCCQLLTWLVQIDECLCSNTNSSACTSALSRAELSCSSAAAAVCWLLRAKADRPSVAAAGCLRGQLCRPLGVKSALTHTVYMYDVRGHCSWELNSRFAARILADVRTLVSQNLIHVVANWKDVIYGCWWFFVLNLVFTKH